MILILTILTLFVCLGSFLLQYLVLTEEQEKQLPIKWQLFVKRLKLLFRYFLSKKIRTAAARKNYAAKLTGKEREWFERLQ